MNFQETMQFVENTMLEVVRSDVQTLHDASLHILGAGGKRVRPRLMVLTYQALGGTDVNLVARPAAAIELVHTASVVHDDINDHGVLRRGRPSVNAIWGRTFALLTGDYLFTKVYELMAPYGDLNVILAEATVALVEGETLQASAVKESSFTRDVYQRIIARKTAALFRAAAIIGARLASAEAHVVDAMAQFAFNVGLAFQIIDDILDLTADDAQLGKTAGLDLGQGRGYAAAYATNGRVPSGVVVAEAPLPDPMAAIKQKVLQGDAIHEGRQQARFLIQTAIGLLDVLPATPAREDLAALAKMVVERDH